MSFSSLTCLPSGYSVLKYFGYYVVFLVIVALLPSAFNLSTGFYFLYKKVILLVFELARSSPSTKQSNYEQDDDNNPVLDKNSSMDFKDLRKEFELLDVCKFACAAAQAVVDDEVTKRFRAEELTSWNLMTRTRMSYHYVSFRATIFWAIGGLFRYFLLLPSRIVLMVITICVLAVAALLINFIPGGLLRATYVECFNVVFCRFSMASIGIIATYHDEEYKTNHGIVVANHTTPIDLIILGSGRFYRGIGQIQPGLFCLLQRYLAKLGHIFFERKEACDRNAISECIKEHASDPNLPPVLIFPEGTCINNTSVMMFRKGTFEVCDVVYPVAIKYNPMFGDPFWNSSVESYGWYLFHLASSWFIYCDVWYLPPTHKREGENAISFAGRVQRAIADAANIVNLGWDGGLKRTFVPPYLKNNKQKEYARTIVLPGEASKHNADGIKLSHSMVDMLPHEALLYDNGFPCLVGQG